MEGTGEERVAPSAKGKRRSRRRRAKTLRFSERSTTEELFEDVFRVKLKNKKVGLVHPKQIIEIKDVADFGFAYSDSGSLFLWERSPQKEGESPVPHSAVESVHMTDLSSKKTTGLLRKLSAVLADMVMEDLQEYITRSDLAKALEEIAWLGAGGDPEVAIESVVQGIESVNQRRSAGLKAATKAVGAILDESVSGLQESVSHLVSKFEERAERLELLLSEER